MNRMWQSITDALAVHWYEGAVTPIPKDFTTGWRLLPYAVIMHLRGGPGVIGFQDRPDQPVPDGTAAFVPPRVRHRIDLPVPSVSTWAHFDVTLFGVIDAFTPVEVPAGFHGAAAKKIRGFCREIVRVKSGINSLEAALRYQTLCGQLAALVLRDAVQIPAPFVTSTAWRDCAPC